MSGALPPLAAWALEALVASALLMALVMLVRAPVRRAFGPRVAYALWLLPAIRLLLPPIPASWRQAAVDTPISRVGETITVVILPSSAKDAPIETVAAASSSTPSLATILLVAWAIVAVGFLAFHLIKHWAFCRRVLAKGVTVDRVERVRVIESAAAAGPMAFGILRPTVAFPADFEERFDADERALALAHELGHHARGDLLANWIALTVLALHWFNPLAWRAFRTFRADQELANDARVLAGRSPYERHAYACAIVKAAHGNLVGAACHLHSVKDLKGRLKMLRTQISPRRLAAGVAAVGAFGIAALGVTASGTSAAERIRTQVAETTGITLPASVSPVAPVPPVTPATPVTPVAKNVHRVVIVKDGTTTTYEGEDARRYMAEHPAPTPPLPPVAPTAPNAPTAPTAPSAPTAMVIDEDGAMRVSVNVDVPEVRSGKCGGSGEVVQYKEKGRETRAMMICTDRIARMAADAQRRASFAQAHAQRQVAFAEAHAQRMVANGERIRLVALRAALDGLRRTRDGFAANRAMPEDARREAIEGIEDSMRDLEQDMSEHD